MNDKHTPGPWLADGPYVYSLKNGRTDRLICETGRSVGPKAKADPPNARLISAAPDLLAACEAVAARCPMCAADLECQDDLCYQVRAAVAKAKGEPR